MCFRKRDRQLVTIWSDAHTGSQEPRGGADAPITVAPHFVNVAQHLYVRRCVPQCPPACGNTARWRRSDFAHRDQMRYVQVSNIRPRDPNIPVPSSNYAVLPARVIACPTIIRPCFTDRTIWRCPCSAVCSLARHPGDVRTNISRWTLFFARSIMRGTVVVAEIFKEARL